ncbi:MAG TPA: DNA polymerase III subunit beta, partial [Thermoanaerobaculia bacterium]|nr:DNA polymerase III subunit beta [Thermoanaerobaculia bacterium]
CQAAVRRVALFSSERSRGVKLSFEKNLLTIASASQELGEGNETLDVDYDGEALSIGLNSQYLLDFLEEAETEKVRLELKDENTQCLCRPEGGLEGASRYMYVVMPMRL